MTITTSALAAAASAAAAAVVVLAARRGTPAGQDPMAGARWTGLLVGLLLGYAVWIWTDSFVLWIVILAMGMTVGSGIARSRARHTQERGNE